MTCFYHKIKKIRIQIPSKIASHTQNHLLTNNGCCFQNHLFHSSSSHFLPHSQPPVPPTRLLNSIGIHSNPKHCHKGLPQINPQLNLSIRRLRRTNQTNSSLMAQKRNHHKPTSPSLCCCTYRPSNARDHRGLMATRNYIQTDLQRLWLPFAY